MARESRVQSWAGGAKPLANTIARRNERCAPRTGDKWFAETKIVVRRYFWKAASQSTSSGAARMPLSRTSDQQPYCEGMSQVRASDQRALSGRQININLVEESANRVDAWKMAAECAPTIDACKDPTRRASLSSLQKLWIALGNTEGLLSQQHVLKDTEDLYAVHEVLLGAQ